MFRQGTESMDLHVLQHAIENNTRLNANICGQPFLPDGCSVIMVTRKAEREASGRAANASKNSTYDNTVHLRSQGHALLRQAWCSAMAR